MIRVLIVEDTLEAVEEMMAHLALSGRVFEVAGIMDLQELEAAVQDLGGVDLLIAATELSAGGGFQVFQNLKKSNRHLVPIFVSREGSSNNRSRLGAYLHLTRPFRAEEISHALRTAVERLPEQVGVLPQPPMSVPAGFSGRVRSMRLFDIVQLYLLAHQRGRLWVYQGSEDKGWLQLEQGKVVDAACDKLQGEEAVQALFQFTEGTFDFNDEATAAQVTIERSWEQVLMQVFVMQDEEKHRNASHGSAIMPDT